jgi:hypothetical protein
MVVETKSKPQKKKKSAAHTMKMLPDVQSADLDSRI